MNLLKDKHKYENSRKLQETYKMTYSFSKNVHALIIFINIVLAESIRIKSLGIAFRL